MVSLYGCNGSCITLDDLQSRLCVPKKRESVNLNIFSMMIAINELKTITKHISCNCKCKFDDRKCILNKK